MGGIADKSQFLKPVYTEGTNRKELKLKVYKDSLDKAALVEEVALKGDIDWLTERSKSFRKFIEQVINFTNIFTQ